MWSSYPGRRSHHRPSADTNAQSTRSTAQGTTSQPGGLAGSHGRREDERAVREGERGESNGSMRRRWGPGGDGSGKEGRKEWGVEKAERGVYIPTRRILLLTYRHSTIQKVCPATSRGRVAVVNTRRICSLCYTLFMKYGPGG
ncbi:hypothetical protein BDN71DRAFT_366472 [Pleurotus eryngii]|uniref:Uncharacterized protein n=1 Tax=Pleurotus eryngii TaxID=5323 RepID=A0A9P5ZJ85_PLEER|nr:hypothetical protein BDN71DRAFT_366472 [Pleurotus eryngii]